MRSNQINVNTAFRHLDEPFVFCGIMATAAGTTDLTDGDGRLLGVPGHHLEVRPGAEQGGDRLPHPLTRRVNDGEKADEHQLADLRPVRHGEHCSGQNARLRDEV